MIQISNNPYGTTVRGMGSRPRLDTGQLGITALDLGEGAGVSGFLPQSRPDIRTGTQDS